MSLTSQFKALPINARRQLTLGIIVGLLIALPLFVSAITSQKFLINQNAQENPPTNACGGTCGSIYNCNVNLFCYQGFCRNPDCPTDLTCGCIATPTPTVKATPKPTKSPTPTPLPTTEVIFLTTAPTATVSPELTIPPTPKAAAETSSAATVPDTITAGIFISADIVIIAIILILIRKSRVQKS